MEICTCHYNEDLKWLDESEFLVNIVHKDGGTPIDYMYCIPNVGYEATAYMKYIIERYDTLPFYTDMKPRGTKWGIDTCLIC